MNTAIATIMVSDFEKSMSFYGDILGLCPGRIVPGEWAEYNTTNGFTIGLHPAGKVHEKPKGAGISIGFAVADIYAARAMLESRGVVFSGPTVNSPPLLMAFFADPDGYPLYLSASSETAEE